MISFITQGIKKVTISFFPDRSENRLALLNGNSDIDCSLFGLTLNNNKRDAAQLRKQNELLNSIIKNNIRKLSEINCTIDKVPDEMFRLRGIYFLDSTVTPGDIQNVLQDTEMMQILGQREDGNLVVRYTESAINQERKERIHRIAEEINSLYGNEAIAHLNCQAPKD